MIVKGATDRNKTACIWWTTHSNVYSNAISIAVFLFKFRGRLFLYIKLTIRQHWLRYQAWNRTGDKPSAEPNITQASVIHTCVTKPQWVHNFTPQFVDPDVLLISQFEKGYYWHRYSILGRYFCKLGIHRGCRTKLSQQPYSCAAFSVVGPAFQSVVQGYSSYRAIWYLSSNNVSPPRISTAVLSVCLVSL